MYPSTHNTHVGHTLSQQIPHGRIFQPPPHTHTQATLSLSILLAFLAVWYSQRAKQAVFLSGLSGLCALITLLLWNDSVCGTTTNDPAHSQWALKHLFPTNPSGSCYDAAGSFLMIAGVIMNFLAIPAFWFSKRIGAKYGKLGDDGTAPPPRPVDDVVSNTTSLFTSNKVPATARYGVVFWLAVAYILFAVGHVEIAASVDIIIQFAGNDIDFSGFQSFSIVRSIQDLLKVNALAMALLLIVFSVMWPYVEL